MDVKEPRAPLSDTNQSLRDFLITVTDRCAQGWHIFHHLGFLPHTAIKDKLPHYREAVAHPEAAVKLSCKQERACQLRAVCRALPPDTSRIRQRPKRARDAFGAGMVPVVNVVLVWLMFSIDVRNAMLR
jgi:hypothetical protein